MLTLRQKQILDYIKQYIKKKDYAPSLEEIKRHFKLKSVGTVHEHIAALKAKGVLKKTEHQARAIEIREDKKPKNLINIPLVGAITAGQPLETFEAPDETITIARNEISRTGKHYALRVRGNSMIDEGIFDGDIVVIRQQQAADNGQTVVAIIDNNQATLKKLYREKNRFRLQPANPTMLPLFRQEVEVRGIVVKIIRNLDLR